MGRSFQKLSHFVGCQNFFKKGGINLNKPGIDVEMGSCQFFVTLQFNHIYFVYEKSKVPFSTF